MDYAHKVKQLQDQVGDKVKIVMRVYSAKPRSTTGRKGIERSGEPGCESTPNESLHFTRNLLLKIAELGIPIANELLYPENTPYIDDLVSYGAIGSRSSLNQGHRELASGMNFPIGVKNPLGEDLKGCADSIEAINHAQEIVYDGNHGETQGNPDAHVVLRGNNINGISKKNYGPQTIKELKDILTTRGLNHKLIIDLNHDNSGKDGLKQPANLEEVLAQKDNDIVGFMVESYLNDGNQKDTLPQEKIIHGTSLTDSCLGREKTEKLILDMHKFLTLEDSKN